MPHRPPYLIASVSLGALLLLAGCQPKEEVAADNADSDTVIVAPTDQPPATNTTVVTPPANPEPDNKVVVNRTEKTTNVEVNTPPAPKSPAPPANPDSSVTVTTSPVSASPVTVKGQVVKVAPIPNPGGSDKDVIVAVQLRNAQAIHGQLPDKDVTVYTWGMKDNHKTVVANYQPGQTVTMTLQPWDTVKTHYSDVKVVRINPSPSPDVKIYWSDNP